MKTKDKKMKKTILIAKILLSGIVLYAAENYLKEPAASIRATLVNEAGEPIAGKKHSCMTIRAVAILITE